MSPGLRDRFDEHRHQHELDADDPGAPPGYLLDPDDWRTPSHKDDGAGCAQEIPRNLWDFTREHPLARGEGEQR